MTQQQEIEKKLQRLEKFNDPVLLVIIFLTIPGVLLTTFLSNYGEGTLIKAAMALCFLFFTWLGFKVSAIIKQRINSLQAQLNALK